MLFSASLRNLLTFLFLKAEQGKKKSKDFDLRSTFVHLKEALT